MKESTSRSGSAILWRLARNELLARRLSSGLSLAAIAFATALALIITLYLREGRTRGSRMLCADELWRLGGHDPYSLIMIRRFGRDPSGSYSVAGCGKCQKLGE